jgi:hypothetical protein
MKYAIYIIILFLFIISSCEKIIPDLPRDNTLDGVNDTVVVEGVSIKYSSHDIVSDNNNDGIINKGETVYLKVYLVNNGSNTANSVKATSYKSGDGSVGLTITITTVGYTLVFKDGLLVSATAI